MRRESTSARRASAEGGGAGFGATAAAIAATPSSFRRYVRNGRSGLRYWNEKINSDVVPEQCAWMRDNAAEARRAEKQQHEGTLGVGASGWHNSPPRHP